MNEHEIARIAAAFNQLRPDWPTKQLTTLLGDARMTDRPRRDVVVALGWVACESNSHTPYRVLETGPWWKAAAVDGDNMARRHATRAESCARCAGVLSTEPPCCDSPTRRRTAGARRPDTFATETTRTKEETA